MGCHGQAISYVRSYTFDLVVFYVLQAVTSAVYESILAYRYQRRKLVESLCNVGLDQATLHSTYSVPSCAGESSPMKYKDTLLSFQLNYDQHTKALISTQNGIII